MFQRFKSRKGFFTLLGIISTIAIILFLCYIALNTYLKKPSFDQSTQKSLSEQNIDTSSYKSTLESTKDKVKDIEKQLLNREGQLLEDIN